jgi:primosomal protein N' (replication factor Y)
MNQLSFLPEDAHTPRLVRVVVAAYVDGQYDYAVPHGQDIPARGTCVEVPFAGRAVMGVVWELLEEGATSSHKVKSIKTFYDHLPPYTAALRAFIEKVAAYNCIPLGQVLKLTLPIPLTSLEDETEQWAMLPASPVQGRLSPKQNHLLALLEGAPHSFPQLKLLGYTAPYLLQCASKGIISYEQHPVTSMPPEIISTAKPLTQEQQQVADILCELQGFTPVLLEGATGAGKTEVFFAYAEHLMQHGKQVLLLVPEIALSLQLVERAKARFGFTPTLWHSSQTPAKRRHALREIMNGAARLIIGARSALFLPYHALGGIIVDEEHEAAYKQEEVAIYHGRDMAVLRAQCEHIPVVLTSATPSLETIANVNRGKYQHLTLTRRASQAALPVVQLIDMRTQSMPSLRWISPALQARMAAYLEVRQQSLLFLNRKGYAPLVLCRGCGHRYECPSCTAWLVYHAKRQHLDCHHCGLTIPLPASCPSCGAGQEKLAMCGPGVERLEEEVRQLFPTARLLVFSGELSRSPAALQEALQQVSAGEVDIIIGTQILAKGHHFPKLRLVGVIDADAGLHGGDIRGSERNYQLLHQLAGRAGRETERGEVLVQTYLPTHPLMQALHAWDREGFIGVEMAHRRLTNMPPFGRLASVIIEGKVEAQVQQVAASLLRSAPAIPDIRIIGPANAPLYKLRNHYRVRFLVIADKHIALQSVLRAWRASVPIPAQARCHIDIDPMSFM